jgi:hypothetical protein
MSGDGSTRLTTSVKTSVGEGRLKVDVEILTVLEAYPGLKSVADLSGFHESLMEFARTCWNEGEMRAFDAMKQDTNRASAEAVFNYQKAKAQNREGLNRIRPFEPMKTGKNRAGMKRRVG